MTKYKFGKRPMISMYGKAYYGFGNMGAGFITQTLASFIMFFGTVIHGMPASLMGLIFSLGVVWDAVTDPVGGYVTDKHKSKLFGKRHGFMIVGCFTAAVFNILLWSTPAGFGVFGKFVWLLTCIILLQTALTFYNTPYNALGIDLSGDYHEQTVTQAVKSVFFLLGTIIPMLIIALLQMNSGFSDGREDPSTYMNMAYISSAVMAVCGFVAFAGTFSHIPRLNKKSQLLEEAQPSKQKANIIKGFFEVLKDKNYRAIIIGYAVSMMASAIFTGVGIFLFTYTFELPEMEMYLMLGGVLIVCILSQPLWAYLSKKIDKKPSLLLGMALTIAAAVYIMGVFLNLESYADPIDKMIALIPALILAGMGVGSLYPLPYSMMADATAYDAKKNNRDRTALFTAFMSFSFKISQALTLLLVGFVLDLIGFAAPGEGETLKAGAANGLGWLFGIGIITTLVIGLVIVSGYGLKKKDIPSHDEVKTPSFEIDRLLSVMEEKKKNRD